MVAYSFKKQFLPRIEKGLKHQTIRANRKRHARPGERLQLYCGMRTKHCFKIIEDPVCTSVEPIKIHVGKTRIGFIKLNSKLLEGLDLHNLARDDGFEDLHDMWNFWAKEHGEGVFDGVLIKWTDAG